MPSLPQASVLSPPHVGRGCAPWALCAGSQVTVTYTARVLPDGPVFDRKSEEEPLQFTTDEGGPGRSTCVS